MQATLTAPSGEEEGEGAAPVGEEVIPPGNWKALFREMTKIQPIAASSRWAKSTTTQLGVPGEEGQIFFLREQIIAAEKRICREEFEWRRWTIAHIAGWFAYDNENNFRSLWAEDLVGRTYRGSIYNKDFDDNRLELRLEDFLFSSGVGGRDDGKEVGRSDFIGIKEVWDLSDTLFVRADIFSKKVARRLRN